MLISNQTPHAEIKENLIGVAHSERVSIYGPHGLRDFLKTNCLNDFLPIYGNYIIVRRIDNTARVITDHFGLSRIYLYRHMGHWAISDSVQDLTDFAEEMSLPRTPYLPAAYSFLLQQGIGQQLSSYRTPVAEIELVPHWMDLVIRDGTVQLEVQKHVDWSHDLTETLNQASRFFASLLNSFLDFGMRPHIRMSAGLDSRCTLASMLCTPNQKHIIENVQLQTSQKERFRHERAIVLDMLKIYPITEVKNAPSIGYFSWKSWKRRFLGTQSHLAKYPFFGPPNPVYTGACGELARVFYEWEGSISAIPLPRQVPTEIGHVLLDDIGHALSDFGGQCAELLTLENKHYHMFRNRFHFGRSFGDSVFNFPPLIYSLLSNGTGRGDYQAIHQLIYTLAGEELLRHPYDLPQKDFSGDLPNHWQQITLGDSDLYAREIYVGVDLDRLEDFSVYATDDCDPRKETRTSLFNREFLSECEDAIAAVECHALLGPGLVRSARKQLQTVTQDQQVAVPGRLPALMAALALNLAI